MPLIWTMFGLFFSRRLGWKTQVSLALSTAAAIFGVLLVGKIKLFPDASEWFGMTAAVAAAISFLISFLTLQAIFRALHKRCF